MATKLWAMVLVFFTTLLTSSAQILWKIGSKTLTFNIIGILTNYYLMGGILIYVIAGILLILSFRGGEVSVLYPIIATSYIWVTFLSLIFLKESLTFYKIIGISLIMAGIASIGKGSKYSAPRAI